MAVIVEMDHQPLLSLIRKQHPPGRLLRWTLTLKPYRFTLSYRGGFENTIADNLSRMEVQVAQFLPEESSIPIKHDQLLTSQHNDPDLLMIIQQVKAQQPSMGMRYMLINNLGMRYNLLWTCGTYINRALTTPREELLHN